MDILDISEREHTLIVRAAAHVIDPLVAGDSAFQRDVTDLDAARLVHRIERGAIVIPSRTGRSWHEVPDGPYMLHLTRVVEECLRLGIVERLTVQTAPAIWRTQLAAAPVHLCTAPGVARCDAGRPGKRLRLLDEPGLVDCAACVFLHG